MSFKAMDGTDVNLSAAEMAELSRLSAENNDYGNSYRVRKPILGIAAGAVAGSLLAPGVGTMVGGLAGLGLAHTREYNLAQLKARDLGLARLIAAKQARGE